MSGPTIDRANSSGDIWTPQVFIDAVERKFGRLDWDLACTVENMKARRGYTHPEFDALDKNWAGIGTMMEKERPLLWLNPPFSNITPWARKCALEHINEAEILLLVPGSIGANWYWQYIEPFAQVYSVGRMVFDNCFNKKGEVVTTPYPKDLILCHYGMGKNWVPKRMQRWRWQDE